MSQNKSNRGGYFLLRVAGDRPTLSPEKFGDDEAGLAEVARRFFDEAIAPSADRIEARKGGLMASLLRRAGRQGLLGVEVPREYGGLGLHKVASSLSTEKLAGLGSFSVAFNSHTGIGMLPLLYYGTPGQKERYLPRLVRGDMIAAFALTEAEAGTDAMAIRTNASRSPGGGHCVLNGEKIFCSNGGIADLFTIFAKVDGEKVAAFLVEKNTPGLKTGAETDRLGICGSSNTSIVLSDARVPVENILGEVGSGHRIAFNVLNMARLKLGAACIGDCKRLIDAVVSRANERVQFGRPIGDFELIRQKIARCALRTYMLESLIYRLAGDMDAAIRAAGDSCGIARAAEEFAAEAAIAKVYGSEALSFVADEAVQIFGGYGYMRDYPAERAYRDCRIYRIFEGTNEINRLIIPRVLIKKALAGQIPLMQRFEEIVADLRKGSSAAGHSGPLEALVHHVESAKRIAIYVAGVAANKLGHGLRERQSVAAAIADLVIAAYALDSGVSRALAVSEAGDMDRFEHYSNLCEASVCECMPHLTAIARQALVNVAGGREKECATYLGAVDKMTKAALVDTDSLFGKIADRALARKLHF